MARGNADFKPGDIVIAINDDDDGFRLPKGHLIIDHFEESNEYLYFKNTDNGGWLPHRFELVPELVVDRILIKYTNDFVGIVGLK